MTSAPAKALRVSVVLFPGSNCDRDAAHAAAQVLKAEARLVWHGERDLGDPDLVILPGGFSYGDYLRCGAMARFSPVMESVVAFAEKGGPVLGICNGFQVLCEAGLLPGALLRNAGLRFVCREVRVRVETTRTPFTRGLSAGDVLTMPVAHGDGNFFAAPEVVRDLHARDEVVFRYVDAAGEATPEANPNGSLENVAGICNARGNVVGLMPHPERAADLLLGSADGARLFASVGAALAAC
ncbi:phosphoribosylformylglycinamidine synthase subunit PurQ [Acidobacteria bacterium ACD]|nr:MAG: phosphoribosylformylglycinamidine synthase subunit PurQ [Acidobacteriota bacterium]MCE7958059.1 phosphoribosylformylglycinamidine synthase subunit PurQ [Acidobacteria bacterium ACB2]MDL1950941.1 phosphoribosylformylglycinamidine synthase subunit PurQ [Acidobacteria bacterium ACD]